MLTAEHVLKLIFGEVRNGRASPVGKFDGNAQGFRVLKMTMDVEQSGEEFVQRVPGDPAAVEIERLYADVACRDFLKDLFPFGMAAT